MANRPHIPTPVGQLATLCASERARLCLVGGGVRDALLGRPMNDWDIEVYGITEDALKRHMKSLGAVHEVGKSFKVYKWSVAGDVYDVAIPKRSQTEPESCQILGTSMSSIKEASKRRDLTINAISYDPITDEYLDPYNGMEDLQQRCLRPVNKHTFLEDPLRVFRAAQFQSRFHFTASDLLLECMKDAIVDALPMERVQGELFKLFCIGTRPSMGVQLLTHSPSYCHTFAPVAVLTQQQHLALDRLAGPLKERFSSTAHHWCTALCVWMSHLDADAAKTLLVHMGVFTMDGFNVRRQILASRTLDRALTPDPATLRHLSTQIDLEVLTAMFCSLEPETEQHELARARAKELDILHHPPEPLLTGKHLKRIGVTPGPEMGKILECVYTAQLNGTVTTQEHALHYATDVLKE